MTEFLEVGLDEERGATKGEKRPGLLHPGPRRRLQNGGPLRVLDPYLALESKVPSVALALELVVILVLRRPPGNSSPLRSQHISAARWVGRIEHQALQAHFSFAEVREIELTPCQ